MSESDLDVLGPVDYLVVEFPADKADFSGEMAAELTALVDRGLQAGSTAEAFLLAFLLGRAGGVEFVDRFDA